MREQQMIAHKSMQTALTHKSSSCIVGNKWLYFHVKINYYIVYANGRRQLGANDSSIN